MALTGMDIFKKLPRTNCGDCGVPTCLAFAMSLAAGKAELSKCPHVSEEAKASLAEASAPPIRPITLGTGDRAVKIGGETVEYRHEKTFVNPPPLAVTVTTSMDSAEADARIARFGELVFERVGVILKPEMIAVKDTAGNADAFVALAGRAAEIAPLILISDSPDALEAAARAVASHRPLLCAATDASADRLAALAKELSCPLVARADGFDATAELTQKLVAAGVNDIVIDPGARSLSAALTQQVVIRRAALKKRFRPLGYPTIVFAADLADDPLRQAVAAGAMIAKYAGIVVLDDMRGETVFPLLLLRMNIFTDPQRPMATTEDVYPIGNPGPDSPVLVSCNFSLTYFILNGEIEGSRVPAWLLIQDTEGLSLLTAWAAGKFTGESVAAFVNRCGIANKVNHKKLIIPGYTAQISGDLEEALAGWEIQIGPREASHLPAYLRNWKAE